MLLTTALLAAQASLAPLPPSHTGLIYVSGFSSHNVVELAPDGTFLRSLGNADTRQPRGVAVDDRGNVVVVCQGTDRIQVFDLAGALMREVTHADLTNGTGLSRDGDGHWFIGNFFPGAILEFDADWQHVRTLTHATMSGVNCVSIESDGSLSVTDAFHGSVHRFDASRQYMTEIDHPSFISPMSIARDSTGSHFVSNGGGLVSKFDASWNFLFSFGQGLVSQPQGILVDELDRLTITNYSSDQVHRFDVDGNLLDSFTLVGASVGRNGAFQTSAFALAMAGAAQDTSGAAQPILTVNGTHGGPLGRVSLGTGDPLDVALALPPGAASSALGAVVYAWPGSPTPGTVTELPAGAGLCSHAPPFLGGSPAVLTNSIGRELLYGTGLRPPVLAPGTMLALPGGAGRPITVTLQALVEGPNGTPIVTNAVVLDVL